ncbi:unnamed protein product [Colletotrichum noveboracense]|uniref:Zn(2)-C6 fungal-type domain-containing protein n=1 Tax=Colletotrichum noveboracense TaxID=2664923 RepID=A0A9W4S010_9PEZI|nr:unnamed protein product [Colletotrichum noveboracense]
MAYRGRVSRGCLNCKEGRVKVGIFGLLKFPLVAPCSQSPDQCDEEKPACLRCRRLKYVCPGYPDQWTLVLRQQDTHAKEHVRKRVERAQRRRAQAGGGQLQGRNITSPPPAWTPFVGPETPSVYKFFTDYTSRSGIAYLTSLKDCYALQPASCLANAIHATALASVARQRSEVGLMDRARLTYGKAIREVNRAIQDKFLVRNDSVLVALFVMGFFQVIAAEFAPDLNPTSEPGCHPHARGALALFRYRAQHRLSNALDRTLLVIFQHLRLADLFTTSYMIPPLWFELEAFINSLDQGSLLDPLVRRAVDVKIRFMSATLGKASDSVTDIVRSGVLVAGDLQDAANNITFDPKFDGPPPAVFNALISISSATHAAVARCLYLTVRLHIFEIISKATSDSFDDMSVHLDQQLLSMPAAAPALVNELGKALGYDEVTLKKETYEKLQNQVKKGDEDITKIQGMYNNTAAELQGLKEIIQELSNRPQRILDLKNEVLRLGGQGNNPTIQELQNEVNTLQAAANIITTPTGGQQKLKLSPLITYNSTPSYLKGFLIQVKNYQNFHHSNFTNQTEKVVHTATYL